MKVVIDIYENTFREYDHLEIKGWHLLRVLAGGTPYSQGDDCKSQVFPERLDGSLP